MPNPRTSSWHEEDEQEGDGMDCPNGNGGGFPWRCTNVHPQKGESKRKASPALQGVPLLCESSAWEGRPPGGSPADAQATAARAIQELLGRLTAEFNRLWVSNSELRAENARLRASRLSPPNGAPTPAPCSNRAPWEAFTVKEISHADEGFFGDDEGHLSMPELRCSPSGRPVLQSERDMLPRIPEYEDVRDSSDKVTTSDLLSPPVRSSMVSGERSQVSIVTEPAQEGPLPGVDGLRRQFDSEIGEASLLNLRKPDDAINPKYMKQGSLASYASELSLLPAWKKQVRQASGGGFLRRMNTQGVALSFDNENSGSSRVKEGFKGRSGGLSMSSSSVNLSAYTVKKRVFDLAVCSGDELTERSIFQRFIRKPSSWECFVWDIVSALFMAYELIMIPLQVFSLDHPFLASMDYAAAGMWTLDIGISFLRGIDIGGVVDLRPSMIARRYVRSWFAIDLLLVMLDWVLIFTQGTEDIEVLKGLRIRRVIRILRIVRLLRFMKLASKDNLREVIHSEKYVAVISIGKLLVVILIVNHYVACGWYGIGMLGPEGKSWTDSALEAGRPLSYHYTTSFHWSMTQFTPASMEVTPTNTLERVFTIGAILIGLVIFSSFVSNMTHSMTNFQQLTSEQQKQSSNLRQFLSTNKVSLALCDRITFFLKSKNARLNKRRLHEADVGSLKFLPDHLLAKLHEEVFGKVIASHPLFSKLHDVEDVCFTHICNLAMTERSLLIGEELFRFGVKSTAMYFVVGGQLSYFPGYEEVVPDVVESGEWLCECALWAKWEHRGRLTTDLEVAEIMSLDSKEFHAIIKQTRSVLEVQRYARIFCTRASKDCGHATYITDLYGKRTVVDAITRQAFSHGDNVHVINKVMMLWDTRGESLVNLFTAWKQITATAKQNRAAGRRASRRSSDQQNGTGSPPYSP